MALFFFDFHDGGRQPIDLVGMELDDAAAARREAIQALTLAMVHGCDDDDRAIACHVRDESGKVIYCAGINIVGGWVPAGAARQP